MHERQAGGRSATGHFATLWGLAKHVWSNGSFRPCPHLLHVACETCGESVGVFFLQGMCTCLRQSHR